MSVAPIPPSRPTGRDLSVSFEFFPPKTEAMEDTLWTSIRRLESLSPDFVSVTYGAGGSTRDRTHRTVRRIVQETGLNAAAHLTCVDASRADVDAVVRDYFAAGVRHIVALRGDPPAGPGHDYLARNDGYQSTPDLVRGIRGIGQIEVSVGCYPEKHPESPSFAHDLDLLKAKVDAGATRAITQFFFEADTFFRFRDAAVKAGINVPIIPGVMLQPNFKGLKRMAGLCQTELPDWLHAHYEGLDDDPQTRQLITAHVAAKLCDGLSAGGVEHFHFYTLNKADLALSTCQLLGVRPVQSVTHEAA